MSAEVARGERRKGATPHSVSQNVSTDGGHSNVSHKDTNTQLSVDTQTPVSVSQSVPIHYVSDTDTHTDTHTPNTYHDSGYDSNKSVKSTHRRLQDTNELNLKYRLAKQYNIAWPMKSILRSQDTYNGASNHGELSASSLSLSAQSALLPPAPSSQPRHTGTES